MATKKKDDRAKIDRTNFIEYLASMSPNEINKLISEKGKKPRPIQPIYFYN